MHLRAVRDNSGARFRSHPGGDAGLEARNRENWPALPLHRTFSPSAESHDRRLAERTTTHGTCPGGTPLRLREPWPRWAPRRHSASTPSAAPAVPPEVGVPVPARHLRCRGSRREGGHPGDRGSSRRPPAAGCAGPHRENCPEVGVPWPARHLRCWGSRREGGHPGDRGPSRRPPAAGCAGPHRENWPEVGVPLPVRHLRCWGPRREGGHPGDRGPSRPPACGGLCRRRSAFPCLRATCAAGVHADRGANREGDRGPSRPPACGGLCRPPPGELARGRRSPACAPPALLGFTPRGGPSGRSGSVPPPACGGLCRPEVGVPLPASRDCEPRSTERAKTDGSELRSLPAFSGGKCERGARPPFTKRQLQIGTRRSARQCAREFRFRREAPGGSGAGAQFLPPRQPKPLQQCAPAPGPLDPGRAAPGGPRAGAHFLPSRQPKLVQRCAPALEPPDLK